jgi:hypothetical protein
MSNTNIDPTFYKPILSISIPPTQREAFYRALMTLRERDGRPFVSLSALVVKAVIAAAGAVPTAEVAAEAPRATSSRKKK